MLTSAATHRLLEGILSRLDLIEEVLDNHEEVLGDLIGEAPAMLPVIFLAAEDALGTPPLPGL